MFSHRISTVICCLLPLLLDGCASRSYYDVVPPALESQVEHNLTFSQIKESPESYQGRLVVLGGEVLSAKRLKEGTRIEVLQLPLNGSQDPVYNRTASQGRFMAVQKEFLDPAKLPPGTRVTITGEVTGSATQPLDESQYTYPTLEIKSLTVWPEIERYRARPYYPYPGPYPYWGPYGGPFRGWGGWGFPYWW
ncbi:MAG: Slp family lipoprotein [Nitrospiraceae bacterium]